LDETGKRSAAGLIFGHSLFVLPPVTSAQQNAYSTGLTMLLVGISILWNYRLIQCGKQRLRKSKDDQPTQAVILALKEGLIALDVIELP
jgi:hypothetical protein